MCIMALVRYMVSAELAGALLTLFFAWNVAQHAPRATSKMKCNDPMIKRHTHLYINNEVCTLTIEHSVKAELIVEIFLRL